METKVIKTQLPYNIFLYREELARRKSNTFALIERKHVITHELQMEFKNSLIRQQWILYGGLEAYYTTKEEHNFDRESGNRLVYNHATMWSDVSTQEEDEFFLKSDNFYQLKWSEGINRDDDDQKGQSGYSLDHNIADIWSDVGNAMMGESNFYMNWD